MAADALAPYIARSSAPMLNIGHGKFIGHCGRRKDFDYLSHVTVEEVCKM